jgi:hypothetical protein
MNYGLHIIETPTGRFVFVGNVPLQLGFVGPIGMTEAYIQDQLRLPASYRAIRQRSFPSREAAQEAALGFGVCVD